MWPQNRRNKTTALITFYVRLSAHVSHVHLKLCVVSSTLHLTRSSYLPICCSYLVIQMDEPFCQPFGNRRLMHCINGTFLRDPPQDTNPPPNEQSRRPSSASTLYPEGDLPAWESCGRIVPKERADFYEFVACNVAFAILALGVLFFRSRRMQVNQARQLAARIGLIRGEGGRIFRR